MMAFHRVLKPAAEVGTARYVFRHALPYESGGDEQNLASMTTTPLQGFGVVLDVKNMEYQSFDSSDQEDEVCARVLVCVCARVRYVCVRCECLRAGEKKITAQRDQKGLTRRERKRGATRTERIQTKSNLEKTSHVPCPRATDTWFWP